MSECAIPEEVLDRAVSILERGGLVAFPTESWYGLAADPLNNRALDRLYSVKRRPADKPILVLVDSMHQLDLLAERIPEPYPLLMERFWPGPLTLIFPANSGLPGPLTAGSGTIAIRCPSNGTALALIGKFGRPVTGTSANISAMQPHNTAPGVAASLGQQIDMILDGGATAGRKGSTIIACREKGLVCVREGQVPFADVQAVVNQSIG